MRIQERDKAIILKGRRRAEQVRERSDEEPEANQWGEKRDGHIHRQNQREKGRRRPGSGSLEPERRGRLERCLKVMRKEREESQTDKREKKKR